MITFLLCALPDGPESSFDTENKFTIVNTTNTINNKISKMIVPITKTVGGTVVVISSFCKVRTRKFLSFQEL